MQGIGVKKQTKTRQHATDLYTNGLERRTVKVKTKTSFKAVFLLEFRLPKDVSGGLLQADHDGRMQRRLHLPASARPQQHCRRQECQDPNAGADLHESA